MEIVLYPQEDRHASTDPLGSRGPGAAAAERLRRLQSPDGAGACQPRSWRKPEAASASIIAKNQSLNEIYASNDLDEEQDFISVIDAIQGEGFNPLWHQNLIVFNPGFTPRQFVSEDEVLAAAAGPNPEITIVETDEVYRCSVVGRK